MPSGPQNIRSAVRRGILLLGLGCVGFLVLGGLLLTPGSTQRGELVVTYVGRTNDAAGRPLAQFEVTNQGLRTIRFGVGSVQVQATAGWPPPEDLGLGTGDWLEVAAASSVVISQSPPSVAGRPWRVPLIYELDRPNWMGVLDGIFGRRWRQTRSHFTVSPAVAPWPEDPAQALKGSPMDSVEVSASRRGK